MAITAYKAAIDGITCLEQYSVTTVGFDNAIACSSSDGGVVRTNTNRDWFIKAVGYGYQPPKMPGEMFTFDGGNRDGNGWVSSVIGTQTAGTSAIVDRVRIFCDPKGNKPFYYHIFISGNGALTGGASSATAATTLANAPPSTSGLKFKIGDDEMLGMSGWELDIVSHNASPIWPGDRSGWPQRDRGNIDATFQWKQYFDNPTELADMITASTLFKAYSLYVTDSLFWKIQWARLLEKPVEYVIRNDKNEPEYTVAHCKAGFSAFDSSAVKGQIVKPDGSVFWP